MNPLRRLLILTGLWLLCAMAHAGTVHYYYTDPQGTVLAKADSQGNILASYDYQPYGAQALGAPPNGPGYTGHVNDPDTGLIYMQARYYDPVVGRFLSVDPVGPAAGNVFNFGRYDYASNNPYRFTDPDGRQSVGEMIDSGANGCGAVSCAGWALLSVSWKVFGAEGVSQIADKGWSNTSGGDRAGAALEVAAVLPPVKILGEVIPVAKEITLSVKAHGEAAVHAADAIRAGKSDVLTIARDGASANRTAATGGMQKVPGKQLDEYPPAMFREGGSGASVRAINSADNMSAGACIGNACRGFANGEKVRIKVEE